MTWAKVCDTLHSHPKALDADLEAMGLWVLALSHCAAYLTDGHLKVAAVARLAGSVERADRLAARLVAAGLWELHPSGDGWMVHDYLEFNPTRAEVLAERDAKRAGGKRGAAKRWGPQATGSSTHGSSHDDGSSHRSSHDSSHPNGSTHGSSQGGSYASAIGVSDAPDPDPDPDPDPKERERAPEGVTNYDKNDAPPAVRCIALDDVLTPELRAIAEGANGGRPVKEVDDCWRTFKGELVNQTVHVTGRWQAWCTRWANNERSARNRDHARADAKEAERRAAAAEEAEEQRKREDGERRRAAEEKKYDSQSRRATQAELAKISDIIGLPKDE